MEWRHQIFRNKRGPHGTNKSDDPFTCIYECYYTRQWISQFELKSCFCRDPPHFCDKPRGRTRLVTLARRQNCSKPCSVGDSATNANDLERNQELIETEQQAAAPVTKRKPGRPKKRRSPPKPVVPQPTHTWIKTFRSFASLSVYIFLIRWNPSHSLLLSPSSPWPFPCLLFSSTHVIARSHRSKEP